MTTTTEPSRPLRLPEPGDVLGRIAASAGDAVAAVQSALTATVGVLTLVVIVAVVVIPRSRRPAGRLLRSVFVRWRWHRALAAVRITGFGGRRAPVRRVRPVPAGDSLAVKVPAGGRVADLEEAGERLAAVLGAREIRVARDGANAGRATVLIVRRDPLARGPALRWPNVGAPALSLWDPVPVGVDEHGRQVSVLLPERNVLLGGEPGAGKSAGLSLFVATAALDRSVRLWLLDGKMVELAAWGGCAERAAGVDVAEALDVLSGLRREMDERYRTLLEGRRRKVTPDNGLPLHVVVCDELAHYLTAGDRKQRGEFGDVLRDLVSRGRAAGIIVLAATQKPSADVIPTSLRDLFGFRWAFRCSTPQASDTILGAGWATAGYSASGIDAACRGVGFLLHEGGRPFRMRAYYLGDGDVAAVAARAEALRAPSRSELEGAER
ncbi:MAG: FtsK/SpoIIIE domain-containing protein [Actinomycetes bacterium]